MGRVAGWLTGYRLRLKRKRLLLRARRKAFELRVKVDRTSRIRPRDVLVLMTLRNERLRLPYFLDYYRQLGVSHFLCVDNDSEDGSGAFLAGQPDVSIWHTRASYRRSRFGMDWLNALARRYGAGHWILAVDADEFFVYPFCDTRPVPALCDWLEAHGKESFGAQLIDLYPKGEIDAEPYGEGQNPMEVTPWFDPMNYTLRWNARYHNLWIQGGPRARCFFSDAPEQAPALNKVPLVRWRRAFAYVDSTHMLLPRRLNRNYDTQGGERACGALLHTKFLHTFVRKTEEELWRREHFGASQEYLAYDAGRARGAALWSEHSARYRDWKQLEELGLISAGGWA